MRLGPNAGGSSGGVNLQRLEYPGPGGTSHDYSTSLATYSAVDSTNLSINFVVPASGNVRINLEAYGYGVAGAAVLEWGIGPHGGSPSHTKGVSAADNSRGNRLTASFLITGLTPGANLVYDWFFASGAAGQTVHTIVDDGTPANAAGPAVMEVLAV